MKKTGITLALLALASIAIGALYTSTLITDADSDKEVAFKLAAHQTNGASYKNIAATGTTNAVKTGAGVLDRLVVNTPHAGCTFTIYDGLTVTSTAAVLIGTVNAGAQTTIPYNACFGLGLSVISAGTAADVTLIYR